jgi:hypothetical protein
MILIVMEDSEILPLENFPQSIAPWSLHQQSLWQNYSVFVSEAALDFDWGSLARMRRNRSLTEKRVQWA